MAGIADPKLKVSWAKEHLDAVGPVLAAWGKSDAYIASRKDDLENERHILTVKLGEVPNRACLLIGDAFYNMRSALDQLVWSLARLNGIPAHTQFPIIVKANRRAAKRFKQQTVGVPLAAIREIKALQPYHRGDAYKSHPLWRLDEMCNLDKHRRIPAHGHVATINFPNITAEDVASGLVHVEATNECNITSVPLAFKSKLDFDPRIPLEVTFGGDQSGICENFNSIVEIFCFVADYVLPRFEQFFS